MAAAMARLKSALELPPPCHEGAARLPLTFKEALDIFEQDRVLRRCMGEGLFKQHLLAKRGEEGFFREMTLEAEVEKLKSFY